MKKNTFLILCSIYILLNTGISYAETVYVKDYIRWSLRSEPTKDSQSLRLIASGMQLTKLEEQGGYSKIQLQTGEIGWVSSANLVKEKTNNILLEEEKKKVEILEKKIQSLQNKSELNKLQTTLLNTEKVKIELEKKLKEEKEKVSSLQDRLKTLNPDKQKNALNILWGVAILLFIIGILLGKYWIEIKMRAKFNGVKIWE